MKAKIIIPVVCTIILLVVLVAAYDQFPERNVNFDNLWNITNVRFVNGINFTAFYNNFISSNSSVNGRIDSVNSSLQTQTGRIDNLNSTLNSTNYTLQTNIDSANSRITSVNTTTNFRIDATNGNLSTINSTLQGNIDSANGRITSKANIGKCPSGYAVQNITNGTNLLWSVSSNPSYPYENFITNPNLGTVTYQPLNTTWINLIANSGNLGDDAFGSATTSYEVESSNLSISVWINVNNQVNNLSGIIQWGINPINYPVGFPYFRYGLYIGNGSSNLDTRACFWRKSGNLISANIIGSNVNYTCTTENLSGTGWNHIVAEYNGTNLLIYKNNVLESTQSMSGSQTNSLNGYMIIGGETSSNNVNAYDFYNGSIDELMLYKRLLNSSEISSIYSQNRNTSIITSDNPFSYWPFNENNNYGFVHDIGTNAYTLSYFNPQGGSFQNDGINVTSKGYSTNISITGIVNAIVKWDNGTVINNSASGIQTFIFLNNQTLYILNNQNVSNSGVQCIPVSASSDWSEIFNFPVACPAGSFVSQINSSITCTSPDNTIFLNLSGTNSNQNINISNYNFSASNLFGFINWSYIQNAFISAVNSGYFYVSSGTLNLNETKLNVTIQANINNNLTNYYPKSQTFNNSANINSINYNFTMNNSSYYCLDSSCIHNIHENASGVVIIQ